MQRQLIEIDSENLLAKDLSTYFNGASENAEFYNLNRIFQFLSSAERVDNMQYKQFQKDVESLSKIVEILIKHNTDEDLIKLGEENPYFGLWPVTEANIEQVLEVVLPSLAQATNNFFTVMSDLKNDDAWKIIQQHVINNNEAEDNEMITNEGGLETVICKAYLFTVAKGLSNPHKFPNTDTSIFSALDKEVLKLMGLLIDIAQSKDGPPQLLLAAESQKVDPKIFLAIAQETRSKKSTEVKQANEGQNTKKPGLVKRASQVFHRSRIDSPTTANPKPAATTTTADAAKEMEQSKRKNLMQRMNSNKKIDKSGIKAKAESTKKEKQEENQEEKQKEKRGFFGFRPK